MFTMTRRWSAVAVIADRTAYNAWYSYRPFSWISVLSTSKLCLFTVSNVSLFLMLKVCCWCLSAITPFVVKRYIIQQKYLAISSSGSQLLPTVPSRMLSDVTSADLLSTATENISLSEVISRIFPGYLTNLLGHYLTFSSGPSGSFTARCTIVQSAVLRLHVCLSVSLWRRWTG